MAAVHSCAVVSDGLRAAIVCTRLVRVVRPIPERVRGHDQQPSWCARLCTWHGAWEPSSRACQSARSLYNRKVHVKVGFGERKESLSLRKRLFAGHLTKYSTTLLQSPSKKIAAHKSDIFYFTGCRFCPQDQGDAIRGSDSALSFQTTDKGLKSRAACV